MLDSYISALCRYAERTGLLQPEDLVFARNALLEALQLDSFDEAAAPAEASLADILQVLTGDAVARGVCPDNQVARDLFDTKLMGVLTPRPHEVRTCFHTLYQISPQKATDWFYRFSQDTNYIRRDRIAKDKSGPTPANTASWTSPSTSPSPRRTRAPSPRPSSRRGPATPSAPCARRTRATRAA